MSVEKEPAVADRDGLPKAPDENAPGLGSATGPASARRSDVMPYVVPMFAYVGLGGIESYLPSVDGQPSPFWYPLAYSLKVLIVAILAWHFRATWSDLKPWPRASSLVLAVVLGFVVVGLWIGLDGRYPMLPMKRVGFDVDTLSVGPRSAFITVRMLGLAVLVPVIEELFWRSFLMRWLIDPDFQMVPIGKVTLTAGAVTSVMFALVHPEWLPALLTGALWAWLLWRTKSVSACIVSHATANLALGIYVIATGDWKFW